MREAGHRPAGLVKPVVEYSEALLFKEDTDHDSGSRNNHVAQYARRTSCTILNIAISATWLRLPTSDIPLADFIACYLSNGLWSIAPAPCCSFTV